MKKEFFTIYSKNIIHKISFADIVNVKSKGAYSEIYLIDGEKYTCSKNLSKIFRELNNHFFRTHKSHIINLNKVKKYKSIGGYGAVEMICGSLIPISRRVRPNFLKVFNK